MHELGFQNMVADGGNAFTLDGGFWGSNRSIRKHVSTLSRNASDSALYGRSLSTIRATVGLAMPTTMRLCMIRIWNGCRPELDYRSIECFYNLCDLLARRRGGALPLYRKCLQRVSAHAVFVEPVDKGRNQALHGALRGVDRRRRGIWRRQ